MHSHWVTMSGEKMSKSLGNILSVPAITEHTRPIALRYYLISVHYRSSIEYSREALDDASKAFERIESFLHRVVRSGVPAARCPIGTVPDAFRQAMDDDLGVPRALAVVHERVRAGNAALAAADHDCGRRDRRRRSGRCSPCWASTRGRRRGRPAARTAGWSMPPGTLIEALLVERSKARAERDFARADAIRVRLAEAGFAIEDTKDGPVWSVADRTSGSAGAGRH